MKKLVVLGVSIAMLAGCSSILPSKTEEEAIVVEKDGAKQLDVNLELGVGEVTVAKGAEQWLEGVAEYNKKKLAPHTRYKLAGDTGELTIEQKGSRNLALSEIKSNWALKLNEDVPMNLYVETGAAVANLDLQGLQLENLEIETGVGDLSVNLGGDWEKSFDTTIESGVGQTTVTLPSEVGVKITVEKGIGSVDIDGFIAQGKDTYVNEAYGNKEVTININVEMGIGNVVFKLDK